MSLCVYHSRLVKTWPAMAAEGLQTSSSTLPQEGTARRLFHFLLICLTRNDGKHSPLKQIINVLGMPHVPCNPPALFASSPRPRLRSRERERESKGTARCRKQFNHLCQPCSALSSFHTPTFTEPSARTSALLPSFLSRTEAKTL